MRAFGGAAIWLVAVVLIALGAAGLVGAFDGPRVGDTDPALTAAGDARLTLLLDDAEADLAAVAADVDALSRAARRALGSLSGSDLASVATAVAEGDELILGIRARTAVLAAELRSMPIVGTPTADVELSAPVRTRHARLTDGAAASDGLDAAWSRFTTSSLAASRLSETLAAHVDAVVLAAERGRDASYASALKALDRADMAIAGARELRNLLSATVEVTTLDQWLDRNEAYDVALRDLYRALDDASGKVTTTVREAAAAEQAARDRLPPDARGLVIIMADIGRGGMNGAVIAIEEARGRLGDALAPDPTLAPAAPTVAPADPTLAPAAPSAAPSATR